MIVVSDTSPITALLAIGQSELLPKLFSEVLVPEAVHRELSRHHVALPAWLKVQAIRRTDLADGFALLVDRGEAEAIALAKEVAADRLLIDERKGRRLAQQQGVAVIGLVGVVLLARRRGLISSARRVLLALVNDAGVYLDSALIEEALATVGE